MLRSTPRSPRVDERSRPDAVVPGPVLDRALTQSSARDGVPPARVAVTLVMLIAIGVSALLAIGASLLFVGTTAAWLHGHVELFGSRPRVAAVVAWILGANVAGWAFVVGRISVKQRTAVDDG